MNAIVVKPHGQWRLRASDGAGHRAIIDRPDNVARGNGDASALAAEKLARKLGWHGSLVRGRLTDSVWVFVLDNPDTPRTTIRESVGPYVVGYALPSDASDEHQTRLINKGWAWGVFDNRMPANGALSVHKNKDAATRKANRLNEKLV